MAIFNSYVSSPEGISAGSRPAAEAPGIYLNNCPQGLHGPIEILSQTAFSDLELPGIHQKNQLTMGWKP